MPESSQAAQPKRAEVLLAARRRCDDMQDGPAAREQMKRDVLETPADLLADLLAALTEARITRAGLLQGGAPKPTKEASA